MITVNRQDLYLALDAVLPHAKTEVELLLDQGWLLVHAMDGYTAGVARISTANNGETLHVFMPGAEAKSLLRSVRTTNQEHRDQWTLLRQSVYGPPSLHVALGAEPGFIYDCSDGDLDRIHTYENTLHMLKHYEGKNLDNHHQVYDPKLLARFEKAGTRMRLDPRMTNDGRYGVALVAVGENFIGLICGIGYEWAEHLPHPDYMLGDLLGKPIHKVA